MLSLGLLLVLLTAGCAPASPTSGSPGATRPPTATVYLQPTPAPVFSGQEAYEHARAQVDLGPRPTGSEAGWATGDYILSRLAGLGWETEVQETSFADIKLRNIIAKAGSGPLILVGAHYDTRPAADRDQKDPTAWILGANDGASGTAVLLELARVLDRQSLDAEVWLTFFDAEDRGKLDGWPFSVGATLLARTLEVQPQAVIVLDMVGDRDQRFYVEGNSDPELAGTLWDIAARLGYEEVFVDEPMGPIVDDHLPFARRGIPAIDIIDFEYPYWHTTEDTLDKISPESLERVGRVIETYLEDTDF